MFERIARALSAFRPTNSTELAPAQSPPTPAYQGAHQGRRSLGWYAPSSGPNSAVLGSLATLRNRSRAAIRNDGYAKGAIKKQVANLIGSGLRPMSRVADPALRAQIKRLWDRWICECDADGLLSFYGLQALAVGSWLSAGEVFARLRLRLPSDGLSVPLQLQVLESEMCPHAYTLTAPNGNRVRAGIELSPIGRRMAYWFYPEHPGDATVMPTVNAGQPVRVPAESVLAMYDPLRPGQLRGLPLLTQALVKLRDLDEFDDATLLKQKLQNLIMGFTTRPASPGADPALDPITGRAPETDANGQPIVGFEPGAWWDLLPGEDVKFSEPPGAPDTYPDFMRQQLMGVAVASDIPYEVLTGDMTKINDRTVRVILNEFRRALTQAQHHIVIHQFCRPTWAAWLDRAVVSGALVVPSDYFRDPSAYQAADWVPDSWEYIQPVLDAQADRDEVRAGFKSLRMTVRERTGRDLEDVVREIAEDNALLDQYGLRLDSDPRRTDRTGKEIVEQPVEPEPANVEAA